MNVENAGLRAPLPSGHLAVDYNSLVAESTEGDCRVFVAGDTVKDCAIYPGGLLSTGLAQGHVAVRGAFPEAWRETFPPVGRRVEGSKMDAFPAVAFWIDDGVATVGSGRRCLPTSRPLEKSTGPARPARVLCV